MIRKALNMVFITTLLGLSVPAAAQENEAAQIAWQKIDAGALLIDVRSPEEYATGHIDGSINIPHDQILPMAWFIEDTSREVVLYCGSGRRAGKAAAELKDRGFEEVFNGTGYTALLEAQGSRQ